MLTARQLNKSEIAAALVVGTIGVFILWVGSGYSFGTARRMGPGFFPVAIGAVLTLLSVALTVEALKAPPSEESSASWRPLVMVVLGIASFAILIERAGMVPATLCLIVLGALGERPVRLFETLLVAAVVAAGGAFIFIYALGLPLSTIRW